MKKICAVILCSLLSGIALAAPSSTTVTFSQGLQGWGGVGEGMGGSWISSTPGKHGAAYYTYVQDTHGLHWVTRTNQAFLGNYGTARPVTISIDVNVKSIIFNGKEVERDLIVELRDYDDPYDGMPYTSVWYRLGPISKRGNWHHFEVTIHDTKATSLPIGWGGTGSGALSLPPGRTFADVLASVDEVAFSTLVPGNFYGWTNYDVAVDNIAIMIKPTR